MSMLDRRLQVLIDEDRWERLEAEAERRGVAVSLLVREAIDERFPSRARARAVALQEALDAPPIEAPELGALLAELGEARARSSA